MRKLRLSITLIAVFYLPQSWSEENCPDTAIELVKLLNYSDELGAEIKKLKRRLNSNKVNEEVSDEYNKLRTEKSHADSKIEKLKEIVPVKCSKEN